MKKGYSDLKSYQSVNVPNYFIELTYLEIILDQFSLVLLFEVKCTNLIIVSSYFINDTRLSLHIRITKSFIVMGIIKSSGYSR